MEHDWSVFKVVPICQREGLNQVQQKLEHTVEENAGQDTPLEQTNVEKEESLERNWSQILS